MAPRANEMCECRSPAASQTIVGDGIPWSVEPAAARVRAGRLAGEDGVAAGGLDRGDDRRGEEARAGVVEVAIVEVERPVAPLLWTPRPSSKPLRQGHRPADPPEVQGIDGVEGRDDARLAGVVGGARR